MSLDVLKEYISQIKRLDRGAMAAARARQAELAKPPGSLGKLEDISVRLAGISGGMFYDTGKRCVIIMCSDNGVYDEGVAATPQSVTFSQTVNFTRGLTGVAALAKQFGADLIVVDVGVDADIDLPRVIDRKIRKSTWNITKGPAMTYVEALQAILTGIEIAVKAAADGYALLGAGEMGIANTTTSAAVLCALTGLRPEKAAGKGAGLTEAAYRRKIEVVREALAINDPNPEKPLGVLAKVGGFDIAALAGVFIGGAVAGVPVVIDGFISMVAALAAARFAPAARDYMFASHASFEQGFARAARALGVEPCLDLGMRLGEGSGCPIMFAVIDAACAVMRDMGTFEQAEINDVYLRVIRDAASFEV